MTKYTVMEHISQATIEETLEQTLMEAGKDFVRSGVTYKHVNSAVPHKELNDFTPKNKPIIAYKQFKMRLGKNGENLAPGYVFPLYVNTDGSGNKVAEGLKIGKWYKSGAGECWINSKNGKMYTTGKGYGTDGQKIELLAMRSGWHNTNTPWGNQRGANKVVGGPKGTGNNYQNTWDSEVWAKVEICVDVDATEKAINRQQSVGSNSPADAYLETIGDSEFYSYKTNSNATKDQQWWIVDKMRIIDILDDDTVDKTNDDFYGKVSAESGRKINSNPNTYTNDSGDIPYWKMPRVNGKRYSKEDIKAMGYEQQPETTGPWDTKKNESMTVTLTSLRNIISEAAERILAETINDMYDTVEDALEDMCGAIVNGDYDYLAIHLPWKELPKCKEILRQYDYTTALDTDGDIEVSESPYHGMVLVTATHK